MKKDIQKAKKAAAKHFEGNIKKMPKSFYRDSPEENDQQRKKKRKSSSSSSSEASSSSNSSNGSVQMNIRKLKQEVYKTKISIHNSRTKKIGILRGEIKASDIKFSFIPQSSEKNIKPDKNAKFEGESDDSESELKSFSQYLIISQNNRFYLFWRMFNTLCCLTSSYFYVVLAAFPTMLRNEML